MQELQGGREGRKSKIKSQKSKITNGGSAAPLSIFDF
jgi:hypothetical protein